MNKYVGKSRLIYYTGESATFVHQHAFSQGFPEGICLFALRGISNAQEGHLIPSPKCDNFASHYTLSDSEIIRAGISNTTANNVNIALNFERSNWATNSGTVDPFCTRPLNNGSQSPLLPESLLSVEEITDTSLYTVPPSVPL